jgi:hypothetical protein
MNRRQLLLRGALVAAMAPVLRAAGAGDIAPAVPGSATLGDPAHGPLLVVHDPAFRRSREFAAALHDRGARVLALEPDALAAWHHTLRAALVATPGLRLAGLTTRTDFLVLADLARAAGLAPLATRDADAAGIANARRRATLLGWVLGARAQGPRAAVA